MGMFDWVKCEASLPDGYSGLSFQTKDFNCDLATITITADGKLMHDGTQAWAPPIEPHRLDFHGDFHFYDYGKDGNHSYIARFTEGVLTRIRLSYEEEGDEQG